MPFAIVGNIAEDRNQLIKNVCKDKMINLRSCEDLNLAKNYCESAVYQFNKKNCTETKDKLGWLLK